MLAKHRSTDWVVSDTTEEPRFSLLRKAPSRSLFIAEADIATQRQAERSQESKDLYE